MSKIGYIIGSLIDGGEVVLNEKSNDVGVQSSIQTEVASQNVLDALLKGVVTEEVKELRYKNYKINEESENFTHIGNGVSVKNDIKDSNITINKMRIFNNFINEGFIDLNDDFSEIRKTELDKNDKTTINVLYDSFVNVNIENFITHIDLNKKENTSEVIIFLQTPYKGCAIGLKKIYSDLKYYKGKLNKCDFISNIKNVTTKVTKHEKYFNIDISNLELVSSNEKNGLIELHFNCVIKLESYYLSDKYYNQKTDDKYKIKSKKNSTIKFDTFI